MILQTGFYQYRRMGWCSRKCGCVPKNVDADIEHRHKEADALEEVANEEHAKSAGFRRIHDSQDI